MSPSPRERFVAALRGEAQDAPTGWMMRQAGRFLPEYRAMREGRTFVEAVEDLSLIHISEPTRPY